MTQSELITFVKTNHKEYNSNASFVVLEPFWNKGAIGITETEWKRGIYICINIDGKPAYKEYGDRVFYFQNNYPEESKIAEFDSRYKKFFVRLACLEEVGEEIVLPVITGKDILEQIEDFDTQNSPVIAASMSYEQLEIMKSIFEPTKPIEEFPIVKTKVETTYEKKGVLLEITVLKDIIKIGLEFEEQEYTKEEFSNLVDLMIEARKDLLK